MFHLMEPLFDISYLSIVLALGIRLLLEQNKSAKLFGITAILLGAGDAFHLIPRVISHLSPGGFEAHIALLSWGEFITGITMTIFYLLFFYYYREISGDQNRKKALLVYALVGIRMVLLLLPQNEWGTNGNYTFGLIRNIPFAVLGGFLIAWTARHRDKSGLRYTASLIAASFLFYLPVVIGASFIETLGLLMIPKTVAYVLLVAVGYRHFIPKFCPENTLKISITFLIMGLMGGVFYREFTKFYGWTSATSLGLVHTHSLVLGFLVLFLVHILLKLGRTNADKKGNRTEKASEQKIRSLKTPLMLYVAGVTFTVVTLMVRGMYDITSNGYSFFPDAALSGFAGIGHLTLGIGIVWMTIRLMHLEAGSEAL